MSERLRIALTKGRLQDKSVAMFERAGLDCAPIHNPGRRLIHSLPNYPLDAVLAKAPDVITYVEHGVCDLGVVGKDTILEHGGSFYEVLDLGFGACRFAIIKIEGSVELAPILGLADGIVDIVETGATLKANGLIPIETVAEVSARLIVNTASMKLYKRQIEDLIEKCAEEVRKSR